MRIQVVETHRNCYDQSSLNTLKETFDVWVGEYGAEKLDWLHAVNIDDSCDVFIKPISPSEVQVGFLPDASKASTADNPIHWVNITVLETAMLDALTQTLLITVGMNCIQSVTGSFSVDWADVRTVLSYGTVAYCAVLDWNAPQQAIAQLRAAMCSLKQPVEIVGCAMLLNQGLRIDHTYGNIQSLTAAGLMPADCLTITNMTDSRHMPQTNVLLFVCKN